LGLESLVEDKAIPSNERMGKNLFLTVKKAKYIPNPNKLNRDETEAEAAPKSGEKADTIGIHAAPATCSKKQLFLKRGV
jgi:hypothetical protein